MRLSVSEIFAQADAIEDKDEKLAFLQKHWATQLRTVLNIAFNKKVKWHLPKGKPPINSNSSVGSPTRLYYEIPKLYRFIENGPFEQPLPNINRMRRESLFMEMIQELTPGDAELIFDLKDGKWNYKTLTKKWFDEVSPGLIDV
jgi:hypothetical protein